MTQAVKVQITPTATCTRTAAEQTVERPNQRPLISRLPALRDMAATSGSQLGSLLNAEDGEHQRMHGVTARFPFTGIKTGKFQIGVACCHLSPGPLIYNRGGSRGHYYKF